MERFLLTMTVVLTALFATAQTKNYTDDLVVNINGENSDPQKTTISVEKMADGTYTLSLNRFILGDMIYVGNIVVDGITATGDDVKNFTVSKDITIAPGDENVEDWIGPMLGEVPVDITGKMSDEKLYCTIHIDMVSTLGQVIKVTFGSDDFTGIEAIDATGAVKVIYDLTGRRVDAITTSGVYIINGKKCIVK